MTTSKPELTISHMSELRNVAIALTAANADEGGTDYYRLSTKANACMIHGTELVLSGHDLETVLNAAAGAPHRMPTAVERQRMSNLHASLLTRVARNADDVPLGAQGPARPGAEVVHMMPREDLERLQARNGGGRPLRSAADGTGRA